MSCVFYRCRQGYIKNHSYNSSTPPDLSQFVETDSNTFLYLIMGPAFEQGDYTFEEFVAAMEEFYPDYRLATPVEIGYDSYNNVIYFWAPGFNLGNEGYETAVRDGLLVDNTDSRVWIVPSLKRVILASARWSQPSYCWKYENDTITGSRLDMPQRVFLYAGNQSLGFVPCNGSSLEDLKNTAKWVQRNFYLTPNQTNPNVKRTVYSRSNSISQTQLTNLFGDADEPEVPTAGGDPYDPGGESEPGGGEGDFDDDSDPIDFPSLPSLSATDTGFITIFNPSAAELKDLASYMWSSGFDLDTFKKLFANPMDCILGLSIVPVDVPSSGTDEISVGNIGTGIYLTKADTQYVEIDCGTLNVNEFWGGYLDYAPYTKVEIYLPYIGTHPLNIDDIMSTAVHVKYHVDILSGACEAYVKCGDHVLYTFIGQCASSIPITGNDWTNVINGVLQIAGSIGMMVATGGAAAPLAIPGLASTAVNGMKPAVEKSGSLSGTAGMLGIQYPYLILTRPRQAHPASQNAYTGYPSHITQVMGDLNGYTEMDTVHLTGLSATDAEAAEIESLLKGGVLF